MINFFYSVRNLIILSVAIPLAVLLFFSFNSCKKKVDKLTISGLLYQNGISSPLSGVHVTLKAKKMSGGAWTSNYETVTSGTTGADGKFSFTFNLMKVSGYRLIFEKTNYFTLTNDFSDNVLSNGGEYFKNYQVYAVAYLEVHIKNSTPVNSSDFMTYQLTGGTSGDIDCCSDTISNFFGTNIDVTRICKTYADQNIKIDWRYTKINIPHISVINITCPAFDTTSVQLFY